MSGFWESELGEVTGSANDAFAKSFKTIPDGTMALSRIEKFENVEFNGSPYINIEWALIDGDFKGQKVSQKIKAFDADPKARHRALNMMKLIYQLFKVKPSHANAPSDEDLSVFIGKQAGIKIRETEPKEVNGEIKTYNWVAEVHEAKGFKCETGVKLEVTHAPSIGVDSAFERNRVAQEASLEDDIPF